MKRLQLLIVGLLIFSSAAFGAPTANLPRVLIIGDSIYTQSAREAAKELKGIVEVVHRGAQDGEVCGTEVALEKIDEWLGKGRWDLIHFNVGLADLTYRARA